jgi:hypothetical protein
LKNFHFDLSVSPCLGTAFFSSSSSQLQSSLIRHKRAQKEKKKKKKRSKNRRWKRGDVDDDELLRYLGYTTACLCVRGPWVFEDLMCLLTIYHARPLSYMDGGGGGGAGGGTTTQ